MLVAIVSDQEQIAQKERQKKEEAEYRRQRDRQPEIPIASQMPGRSDGVPMSPQHLEPQMRLNNNEDPGAEQRRKKQEEMKRVLAEQIAEKERQKKEEDERRLHRELNGRVGACHLACVPKAARACYSQLFFQLNTVEHS